jgi:PAS domain S-box-containing protein
VPAPERFSANPSVASLTGHPRRPFLALVIVLLLAVGISVVAGLAGIRALDRSLTDVTEGDAARLLAITHVRRLFRSEVVLEHELQAAQETSQHHELSRRREAVREERAILLDRLGRLGGAEQEGALATLRHEHEIMIHEGPTGAQKWEPATALILNGIERTLVQVAKDAKRTSASARAQLVTISGLAALLAGMLAAIVLRRVRAAADQLSRSEAQFRTVVQSAPSLLTMLSTDRKLVFVPPRAHGVLGMTLERLKEDPLCWVKPEFRAALEASLDDAGSGSQHVAPVTVQAMREDGTEWYASASVTPMFDSAQRVSAILLQVLDISTQRAAEQARQGLEEQLRQSQKMESVGRLAGGIAHDFNNLLTAIQGYASLAQEEALPADARDCVDGIVTAADRAAHLTRQLLAFSRKHVISPTLTDLGALVRGIEKMLVRVIGEDVHLEVHTDEHLSPCLVDRNQVEQVIMNLAINARHAMPSGGNLVIEVRDARLGESYAARHPAIPPGEYVLLTVSDNGHGMSKEVQEHIFEPFFTTKPVGQGTGLGLSVVYGTVQQHGGTIDVYSEIGNGSTFRIYWPCAEARQPDLVVEGDSAGRPRGTERVFLVEDDPLVRDFATKTLTQLGYQVTCAHDAAEALRLLKKPDASPELLVTDLVLPGTGGIELARSLGARFPNLPVLYMSGYSERLIAQRDQMPGALDYLPKPFDAGTLARRVRQALDQRSLAARS